jgi:hypothetical protein
VRAIREGSRHSVALVSIAVAGLLLQIASVASSGRRGDLGSILSDPVTAIVVLIKRVFAASALGDLNLMDGWRGFEAEWWVWLVTLTLIAAMLMVWSRSASLESAALVLSLVGGWILALYAMSEPGSSIALLVTWPTAASRFFLVPVAVLFVSLIVVSQRSVGSRVASGLAAMLLAVGVMSDYRLIPLQKVDWEPFATCVEQALTTCSTTIAPDWPLQIEPAQDGDPRKSHRSRRDVYSRQPQAQRLVFAATSSPHVALGNAPPPGLVPLRSGDRRAHCHEWSDDGARLVAPDDHTERLRSHYRRLSPTIACGKRVPEGTHSTMSKPALPQVLCINGTGIAAHP